MPARFVSVDRDTPMLLPPDLREWVPEDDLVHFVIEAVDRLPLESFRVNHRGTGAKQFPPHMMLALLIYSYANGLFSSRKIERATHRDVAIRYLTAGTHPDHDTICKFRRENLEGVPREFCRCAGVGPRTQVAQVSSDLISWDPLGTTAVSATSNEDETETVIWRSLTPFEDQDRNFIRLRVAQNRLEP